MILAKLLEHLRGVQLEVIVGDPSQLEIWRVTEYLTQPLDEVPGTLYLLPSAEALEKARLHMRYDSRVAFLVSASLLELLPQKWLTGVKATIITVPGRIPLDLSARVQRALDVETTSSLSGDAIARARQDLIFDLLLARYRDEKALLKRAHSLGVAVKQVRSVMVVGFDDFERFYLQNEAKGEFFFQQVKGQALLLARRVLSQHDPWAVITPDGEGAVILLSVDERVVGTHLANVLRQELQGVPLVAASGTARSTLGELAQSYQEALTALRLRSKLHLRERYIHFSQVTGYALLQRIENAPEIASMLLAELSPLMDMDRRQLSRLVETLAAYLDAGSSLKEAARSLNIHPKTLRYRLDRLRDLLGPSALDGEKRLLMHLAAKYYLWLNL